MLYNDEKVKDLLDDLDCNLTSLELAVIGCLKEYLINFIPEEIKNVTNVDKEIDRVIDNYRLQHFYELLLDRRIFKEG